MYKIIIRCDGGNVPEIGTGHIYRCEEIAKFLIKNKKVKKKDLIFFTKKFGNYKFGYKHLKKKFNTFKIKNNEQLDTKNEINLLKSVSSKLLIIDRLDNFRKSEINELKKKHKKIVLIDSLSKNKHHADLYLNPLMYKKNSIFSGYKYMILPMKKLKYRKKKMVFIYFGGYDHKNIADKVLKECDRIFSNYNICTDRNYIFKNNILKKLDKSNFHLCLSNSSISITSGGLTMFNSILYKTPNISIPQYRHQLQNAINLNCTLKCNLNRDFKYNFRNIIKYVLFNKKFNIIKTKMNSVSKILKKQLGLKQILKTYEN